MNFDRFPPAKFPLDVKICFQPQIVQTEARRCGFAIYVWKSSLWFVINYFVVFSPNGQFWDAWQLQFDENFIGIKSILEYLHLTPSD